MEDRYIMMVDESGQPYICHAGMFQKAGNAIKSAGTSAMNAVRGVGRGVRQNHKYIMKVGTPDRPRYLYTQEEVRAYLQGGRRALNNAANKAGQTAKNAVNTAKNTAKKTVETVKDKAGVDERQRVVTATKQYVEEWKKAGNNRTDAYDKAARNLDNAVSDYQKTPLGKAEKVAAKVTRPVRTVARAAKKLDDAVDIKLKDRDGNVITAKDVAKNAVENVKNKGEEAADNLKTKYERMRDEYREKKENKPEKKPAITYTERDKEGNIVREEHGAKALGQAAKLAGAVAGQVIKNKTEQKVARAKMAANDVADRVEDAADKVKDTAEDVVDSVRDAKKDAVNYAKKQEAKLKAKKYDKEWTQLDQEAQRLRRENGGNDSYAVLVAEARAKNKWVAVLKEDKIANPNNHNIQIALDKALKEERELWDKANELKNK